MIIKNPLYRIVLRMLLYGTLLGSLAGCLFFYPTAFYPVYDTLLEVLQEMLYPALVGGIWGGLAGLFSGFALFHTSKFYMEKERTATDYHKNSAIWTAMVSGFLFMPALGGIASIVEWASFLFFASWILIAVGCSLRATTLLLRESDVRKRKVK